MSKVRPILPFQTLSMRNRTLPPRMLVMVPRNTTSEPAFASLSDTGAQSQPSATEALQTTNASRAIFTINGTPTPTDNALPRPWGLCPQTPGIYRFCARMLLAGRLTPPHHSGHRVGAPVASLRCRILRPVALSINVRSSVCAKCLPKRPFPRYKYFCPGSAPLAGFEVSTYGRFSDVRRGSRPFPIIVASLFLSPSTGSWYANRLRMHQARLVAASMLAALSFSHSKLLSIITLRFSSWRANRAIAVASTCGRKGPP